MEQRKKCLKKGMKSIKMGLIFSDPRSHPGGKENGHNIGFRKSKGLFWSGI
jgi:hypothetical protein